MLDVILSLVGGAVAGLVVERLYKRWRADAEDYELWLSVRALTLMAEETDRFETGLRYVIDGVEVSSPHVMEIDVWNAGAKDIRADMFDGEIPISLMLGTTVVKELNGGRDHETDSALITLHDANSVRIAPSLLKRGMLKRFRLLVDGPPDLTWTNRVADLQMHDLDQEWEAPTLDRRLSKIVARVLFTLLGLTFFVAVAVAPFLPDTARQAVADAIPQPLGLWVFLPVAVMMLAMLLVAYGANPSRRPRRAAKVRSRSLAMSPRTSSEPLARPLREQSS